MLACLRLCVTSQLSRATLKGPVPNLEWGVKSFFFLFSLTLLFFSDNCCRLYCRTLSKLDGVVSNRWDILNRHLEWHSKRKLHAYSPQPHCWQSTSILKFKMRGMVTLVLAQNSPEQPEWLKTKCGNDCSSRNSRTLHPCRQCTWEFGSLGGHYTLVRESSVHCPSPPIPPPPPRRVARMLREWRTHHPYGDFFFWLTRFSIAHATNTKTQMKKNEPSAVYV